MNAVQQTLLGLVLVGIAFVFGSYLHRDNAVVDNSQSAEEMENISWQAHEGQSSEAGLKSIGSSMPRLQPKLVEANLVPDLDAPLETPPANQLSRSLEIAEPDFSNFAIDEMAPPEPITDSSEIASNSNFKSFFPATISVNQNSAEKEPDQIAPVKPRRDTGTSVASQDQGLQVVQRRLSFDPPIQEDQAPPVPNSLRNKQLSDLSNDVPQRVGPLQTMTKVSSIRPRISSPVMMETSNFVEHKTIRGETLQELALKYFGNADYYLDIYVANKQILNDPSEVPAGVRLKIPVYK